MSQKVNEIMLKQKNNNNNLQRKVQGSVSITKPTSGGSDSRVT